MWGDKPYYSLDYYCKETYHEKLYKIAIDAGFTCPNRDGTLDTRGCIFCSQGGSGEFAVPYASTTIQDQIKQGLSLFHNKKTGNRFIAYFQAYTNTYAPVSYLRKVFTESLSEEKIAGISIATRPDCLSDDVLLLLDSLKKSFSDKFIWVELGLQTIHESTADFIRRGYSLPVFEKAVLNLNYINIPIIVHIIIGLPGESTDMILKTVHYLNRFSLFGIKIQLLHVLKGTDLANYYNNKFFSTLSEDEYVSLVISCLEILSKEFVIHRLTGDGPKDLLIAPIWSLNKRSVLNSLHKKMKEFDSFQGKYFCD